MRPRVLVIGDRKSLARAAAALGAEVWWVQRPGEGQDSAVADADLTLLADYTEESFVDLMVDLHQVRPFAAVVAISENALLPAAAINDRLGLRGAGGDTVRMLTDKSSMRLRLAECGLSPVAAALGSTPEDLLAFGRANGFPFIAKPIAATGSYGVTLVKDAAQADEVAQWFGRAGSAVFLMEEYLDGPEISVESFSFAGQHVVLSLTDKIVGEDFIETGHAVPAIQDKTTTAAVVELILDFLDTVGLRHGPSHVEVKLTARGPRVIEGHNRRGGDRINDLVRLAYHLDMEELTVAWAMGQTEPLLEPPTAKGGAAIRFMSSGQGRVVAIDGVEEVRAEPDVFELGVRYATGERIGPTRWSLDRPGYVIVTGNTAAEAAAAAAAHAARVVFTVAPDPDPIEFDERALSRELDLARHLGFARVD